MRSKRILNPNNYHHVISRIAHKEFLFTKDERKRFTDLLWRVADFSGVEVATFAVVSNHFHILVHVPAREEVDDAELHRRMVALYGATRTERYEEDWQTWTDDGQLDRVDAAKKRLRDRMYDLPNFVKTLKETYTKDYNRRTGHTGTLWESRFTSILVGKDFRTLMTLATYIDANPVKAGLVDRASRYVWCGFGAAMMGDRRTRRSIRKLVATALALPMERLSEDDALSRYAQELDRLRKGCATGGISPNDMAMLKSAMESGTLSVEQAAGFCHVSCFERGGAIGSAEFICFLAGKTCSVQHIRPGFMDSGLYTAHGVRGSIITSA